MADKLEEKKEEENESESGSESGSESEEEDGFFLDDVDDDEGVLGDGTNFF